MTEKVSTILKRQQGETINEPKGSFCGIADNLKGDDPMDFPTENSEKQRKISTMKKAITSSEDLRFHRMKILGKE